MIMIREQREGGRETVEYFVGLERASWCGGAAALASECACTRHI